jgi:hypothetical protein
LTVEIIYTLALFSLLQAGVIDLFFFGGGGGRMKDGLVF